MLKLFKILISIVLLTFALMLTSCEKPVDVIESTFTLDDEILLGEVLRDAINEEGNQYPILKGNQHAYTTSFVNTSITSLLPNSAIAVGKEFEWQVFIIENDSMTNAFTLPGGFVYIYTGLLKNHLNSKAELLGLISHKMATAERRMAAMKLKNEYSEALLLDVALGNNMDAAMDLIQTIAESPYKVEPIEDADESALELICPTSYTVEGFVNFLTSQATREDKSMWAMTHPVSSNRATSAQFFIADLDCGGTSFGDSIYEDFVSKLP